MKTIAFAVVAALASYPLACAAQELSSKVSYQGIPRYVGISRLTSRSQDGLLMLHVEIANSDTDDHEAFYRVSWMDGDGFPVWDEEAWKPVLLHGRQQRAVLIAAPTRQARDFRVHFSASANSTLRGSRAEAGESAD